MAIDMFKATRCYLNLPSIWETPFTLCRRLLATCMKWAMTIGTSARAIFSQMQVTLPAWRLPPTPCSSPLG